MIDMFNIRPEMDYPLAAEIKALRLLDDGSWRYVAREITGIGNQLIGRDLCKFAAEYLGEDWD